MPSGISGVVYGVGLNDADYNIQCSKPGEEWLCPFYMKWKSMMQRGYSTKFKEKNPSYIETTVCKEWHSFMNFRDWMVRQEWGGNQLDKDFISEGNNVYSPDNCVFVPRYVNALLTDARASRGKYPLGVNWNKKGSYYQMKCCNGDGSRSIIDCFNNPLDAHFYWVSHKIAAIYLTIDKYEKEKCFDERVKTALLGKIEKLRKAIELREEIKRV